MGEDKGNRLTCYTGRTSRSGGRQSSDTQHMYRTAHRPPQGPEPPKPEEWQRGLKCGVAHVMEIYTGKLLSSKKFSAFQKENSKLHCSLFAYLCFGICKLVDTITVAAILSLHHTQGGKLYEKVKPSLVLLLHTLIHVIQSVFWRYIFFIIFVFTV